MESGFSQHTAAWPGLCSLRSLLLRDPTVSRIENNITHPVLCFVPCLPAHRATRKIGAGGSNHLRVGREPPDPGLEAPHPRVLGHLAPAGLPPGREAAVQGGEADVGVRDQGVPAAAGDAAVAGGLLQLTRGETRKRQRKMYTG